MYEIKNLIQKVTEVAKHEGADKNFIEFLSVFYSQNQGRDFHRYSTQELYDYARLGFSFFANKKVHEPKIRIYNPSLNQDGFESQYTVLEMVNEDMPFLVDSIVSYLDRHGIKIYNIIHPIYHVLRDKNGDFQKLANDKSSKQESVIQLHLEKIVLEHDAKVLHENVSKIVESVALVVGDWKSMTDLAKTAQDQLNLAKKIGKKPEEIAEIKDFISWAIDGHFIFLGAKEFDIKEVKKGEYLLEAVENSGFGVFASNYKDFLPSVTNSSVEEVCDSVKNPYVIEIVKSRYRSQIHRNTNAERFRVQKFSADGKVVGEYRFIGLFTSSAYNNGPETIPLVRNKIMQVIEQSGYTKGSHNHKDLISVLESYPRDELFQISAEDLLRNAVGIVAICGRSQVRFFARKDKFRRFISCLIFTPRERSNSDLREKIKNYLSELYKGEVTDSFIQITDSRLTRFHLIIRIDHDVQINELEVENEISKMTRIWSDDLRDAIKAKFDDGRYLSFFSKYKNAFSVSYMNRFDSKRAAIDIPRIEECLNKNITVFNLYKSSEQLPIDVCELKIYRQEEIILSGIMPILESFGFNVIQEHTYVVNVAGKKVWIHYFHLNLSRTGDLFSEKIRLNFEKTISLIWQDVMQVGLLNSLTVAANLHWKHIYMLRGYTKYIYQISMRYSNHFIADVLVKYRDLTKMLVELFEVKFDISLKLSLEERKKEAARITARINEGLNAIKDPAEDVVVRKFLEVINATTRTNYYQHTSEGTFKGYLSFKFDCKKISNLPLPVPHAEIFVYSNRVEAVHLRGGKVARGGLRWSDRQEDFRTEVLGLVKAQMTKNAVIVPVGSKGGFVVKRDVAGLNRDEIQKEGIECYKTFLRGLLDVTDNVIEGKIKHPNDVIIHDDNDPYLVVAADKGTATFSDIANSVSAEYNFWLGDAFASGGSVGYDHKKMGITAKGGWISVMRHFREMGIDTQSQDFTCVGIGDLAGDVFGNGMLLSKHIKLVAAFNHMHIFLDPNPDAAKSFVERQRMFNLPRSSWMDYDKSLISKGGGIFERNAKTIAISAEVQEVLGVKENELAPNDLIKAILKAPVDLLWNGGIGTYVKATDESHQEVGDRSNDALRINGCELRCKVIGEGGNLGFTQKGRIEYALNGGRINTDAMDNSAGVDCSDHEVNIKIALTQALFANKITLDERNQVLEAMTDEVSHLVLNDNHAQTQAISIAVSQGPVALGYQSQFLDRLEKTGLLNRKVEFLPSKKDIEKRQVNKIGLTRPELCVMLAYAKMDIYNSLLGSDLVKDPYFEKDLFAYFPKLMQEKFADQIRNHQLRNEIIATQITNMVVNYGGIAFINQLCHDSGFSIPDVVKGFVVVFDAFRLREICKEIEDLDKKVSAETQLQMFLSAGKLRERSILWLLRHNQKGDLASIIARFRKICDDLSSMLPNVLAQASVESFERKIAKFTANNVDRKLAVKVAAFDPVASAFDIAEIAASSKIDLETIAKIYFAIGTRFSLKWMRSKVSNLSSDNYWQRLSAKTILEDLYFYQAKIAQRVVNFSCENKNLCQIESVEKWAETMQFLVDRFDNFVADLKAQPNLDLSFFIVALNRLKPLVS